LKKTISPILAGFLVFCMAGGPAWTTLAWAQTADNMASDDEVQEIQHLAQAGYLGDSKTIDLSAKSLTEDQVTDALLAIENVIRAVDLSALKPGDPRYSLSDLQTLLQLEQDYSELIRDRKVSSWLYEKRLNKMIAALTTATGDSSGPTSSTPTVVLTPTPGLPAPTPTPSFSVSEDDWNHLKDTLQQLTQKSNDLQIKYDQKLQDFDTNEQELKTRNQEMEDEMKLVKNLMDTYESNLQKLNDRLDQVSQKANEKTLTDEELNEELTNMEKDLRDNTQDLTVLKQDVALLKAPEKPEQSPLDDFLTSKWLAGGALLVGLTALTISLTRK
jgi:myosin heavy subunit